MWRRRNEERRKVASPRSGGAWPSEPLVSFSVGFCVQVLPCVLPVRVLLVALEPRLDERRLDGEHVEHPRGVGGLDLGHATVESVAFRPVRERARLAIERVVFGEMES